MSNKSTLLNITSNYYGIAHSLHEIVLTDVNKMQSLTQQLGRLNVSTTLLLLQFIV